MTPYKHSDRGKTDRSKFKNFKDCAQKPLKTNNFINMKSPILNFIFSYEDENKEVPEEDKDKVVIYTTSLGVNRELVANCNRAIQIIRSYKVNLNLKFPSFVSGPRRGGHIKILIRFGMKSVIFSILNSIKKVFGNVLGLTVTRNFLPCREFISMEFILVG